ncbi:unnamed protein product, partial [marine sediment metagenome]
MKLSKEKLNSLSNRIIGLAIKVHKELGPGFVEKIYEKALAYEFEKEKLPFVQQGVIKVRYEDLEVGNQRVDFIVEDEIIIELKTVSEMSEIHQAQMISYLKTIDKRLGLILNFAKKKLE